MPAPNRENTRDNPKHHLNDFYKYVEQYQAALLAVGDVKSSHPWPQMLLSGILIELAFKTYLCAAGKMIKGHDLGSLAAEAEREGLSLTDDDCQHIVTPTNEYYYNSEELQAGYLCRYPMPNRPTLVSVTPSSRQVVDMTKRIIEQAKNKST